AHAGLTDWQGHEGWQKGDVAGFDNAYVYVPERTALRTSAGSTDKHSLVIHLVGCGQTAEQAAASAGWKMAADKYGMIVVVPDPMAPAHPNKVAKNVECYDYGNNDSDFKTLTLPTKNSKDHAAIIAAPAKLADIYPIDEKQVYVAGLSAGAAIAMEVACMAPDVFAGVGEAAGPAWGSRQQQAVAAVGGSHDEGMMNYPEQTNPGAMKDICLGWAGNKSEDLKDQVWAIVSDDNFLPIGKVGSRIDMGTMPIETEYYFEYFDMGDLWDGDKFTPTIYHDYVTEVMQELILDNAGTKTEKVITSSKEHGQGAGCSLDAANFEWDGHDKGANVDMSDVKCLPKNAVYRDWEAKAEIWSDAEGYKKLVRIQQDTLKHSWPIGSENREQWVDKCVGTGGITVDQIYNPKNAKYNQLKDSDGMWKVDVVEDLPHGAIGCIYHNYRTINFPMYLGKLWNNNNPALGDAITDDQQCEDLNNNGVCDDEEQCEDLNNNGVCDDEEQCEDLNNNGVCDDEEQCEDLNNNGICDDEEQQCEDLNDNGICDDEEQQCEDLNDNGICDDEEQQCEDLNDNGICDDEEQQCEDLNDNGICDDEEVTDGLQVGSIETTVNHTNRTVIFRGTITEGDAAIASATLEFTSKKYGITYGPFSLSVDAQGAYAIAFGNIPEDTYTVTVRATDLSGDTATGKTTFKMGEGQEENVPPQISGFIGSQDGDNCVVFSGKAIDSDGSVTEVNVRATGIGAVDVTRSGDNFNAKLCNLDAGTYTATAVAVDNMGASSNQPIATATIEGQGQGGEPEVETGTFYSHWSAGRISGSMWAQTPQYKEMKDKYCPNSWMTMFCTTEITMKRCPGDEVWVDSDKDLNCEGGVAEKKADVAVESTDLGTINVNKTFVIQPTVVNNGPDAASAVSLTVVVPAGINVDKAAINADCIETSGTIQCALGSIASGSSKSVAIPAKSSTEGGYSIGVAATTAQTDETFGNNSGVISVVIGRIVPDEDAPVISSISLMPSSEVEEGKSVKVTVVASDNKGVTSGSVSNVAGGKLCTLALKSGTKTAGTFECSFVAPDVEADAVLAVEATVADAAGNSADSDLAQITVKFVEDDDWVAPQAYSDFGGNSWTNNPNPDWYKADKNYSNYNDYYEANKDKNLSDLNMYLHVPAGLQKDPAIVIVMHGCNQAGYQTQGGHAKSYNTDTDWTGFADKHKFIALFPEVVQRGTMSDNNGTGGNRFRINGDFSCFAWAGFYGLGLNRDEGDAKTIMNMVDWVKEKYDLDDDSKIYATGFSAGGGMAAALATIYPDQIAGVSTNAGLAAFVATANVPVDSISLNSNGSPRNVGESHPIVKEIQYTMGATTGFDPNNVNCQKGGSGEACMNETYYQRSAQELGDFARDYGYRPNGQDYTGPYPKVIAFQGMADQFVDDRNAELIARQFTNLHGIDMVADGPSSINGTSKHEYKEYQNGAGEALVATVEVPNMCHAVTVDPGNGASQGGKADQGLSGCTKFAGYSTDGDVYHVYESAKFWGLVD
ncbi:MAG: hypothetical protein D6B28_06710, partial [Gammaproteobacteria bacterium]